MRPLFLCLTVFASTALALTATATTTDNANLRASMSTTGKVLAVIPKGTGLTLSNCTVQWCATTFKGQSGYVSRGLLSAAASPAPVPAAPSSDVFYANCTAARTAGAAPIRVGEPGYRPKLDRDGDGIACE